MSKTKSMTAIIAIGVAITLNGCKENGAAPNQTSKTSTPTNTATDDHPADHGHEEAPIGTLTIGDMEVACSQGHGKTEPGKEMHLIVKLPHNDGGSTIVRAWIGTEDRLTTIVGKGEYASSHDDYDIHVEAPDPLPADAKWWIEIEKPDGSKSVGSIAFR